MTTTNIPPQGHNLADLHRAVIVAELAHREAIAASVEARTGALSMLDADLRRSREADVAAHKAHRAKESADAAYRQYIRESYP